MRMRMFGTLLVICGILMLVFLILGYFWQQRETQRLMDSIEAIPFHALVAEESAIDAENVAVQQDAAIGHAFGILHIPKISLKSPIVEGVAARHLKVAVGHLPESGDLGKSGHNFVIAGHRSSIWGQFFNRLDDLDEGDTLTIQTRERIYSYTIYEKRIVVPEELDAVQPVAGKKLLTLVTCHPIHSSAKRLLIFAEQTDVQPTNDLKLVQ